MFNYKKFTRNKFSQHSGQPTIEPNLPAEQQPVQNPTSGSPKILDDLDKANTNTESDAKDVQFVNEINRLQIRAKKEKKTYDSITEILKQIQESPFAKVAPSGEDPCTTTSKMFENYFSPDEVADAYGQYMVAFQKVVAAKQAIIEKVLSKPKSEWSDSLSTAMVSEAPQVDFSSTRQASGEPASDKPASSKPAPQQQALIIERIESNINDIQQDINKIEVTFLKEQRKYNQYQILYQDMFNYYSLLSRICETETRYNAQVKSFKFGDPEDYRALLSYYEYGIALLQTMAPKAAQVSPGAGENLIGYYNSLISKFQANINELSLAPLKALYGKG
jgi:hypothetical protein